MEPNSSKQLVVKKSISFQPNLLDWLVEESERQEHGNVSRIVQDAVREYRLRRMAEELARGPELSRVA
jgi:metal-responsive CopG/Arc/MetJ family transcriptional regulator